MPEQQTLVQLLSIGVYFNPPCKQKEEVALCDWVAGTSCL